MTNHDIATKVLLCEKRKTKSELWYVWERDGEVVCSMDFDPLSNAQDDCIVLKHIRENWDSEQIAKVGNEINTIQCNRAGWPFLSYEPGDFSRAALKVIEESESGDG